MTKLNADLMTPLPASDSGSAAVWGSKRINPRPQSCLCLTWSGYPSNDDNVDAAYQDFCNTIKKAAKKTIPCRYQNNYILCWNAECESLYKTFLQSPQGDDLSLAITALLAKLDRKRKEEGLRQFTALTSHTLVKKCGVF